MLPESALGLGSHLIGSDDEGALSIGIWNVYYLKVSSRSGLTQPNARIVSAWNLLSSTVQHLDYLVFRHSVLVNVGQAGFRIVPETQIHCTNSAH